MIQPQIDPGTSENDIAEMELPRRGAISRGLFEINGIRFPIPPQGISVTEQNQNFNFETLRTRESVKVRSGHSRLDITVTALFTGNTTGSVELYENVPMPGDALLSINETLMPILYSLKKLPLCFVDNEMLRTTLPVMPDEVIGCFLRSVNVSTTPGMPYTLTVEFQFAWFNHRPFSPRLKFRKEWYDPVGKTQQFVGIYRDLKEGMGGEEPSGDDGRAMFMRNYGHPGIVFNATAGNTATEDILEARPLLEWLWPYKYPTTNMAVQLDDRLNKDSTSYASKAMAALPQFELLSFDQELIFDFTVAEVPDQIDTPAGRMSVYDIAKKHYRGDPIQLEAPVGGQASIPQTGQVLGPQVANPNFQSFLDNYKMPHGGKMNASQRGMAQLIYARLTNAGMTPAFATAAIVQASFESSLDPYAKLNKARENGKPRPGNGTDFGLFQINNVGGLGKPDPHFEDGKTAGDRMAFLAEPTKYYDATDPEKNIERFTLAANQYLRRSSRNKFQSPSDAFLSIFNGGLGFGNYDAFVRGGHTDLAERWQKSYPNRSNHGAKYVPGWTNNGFGTQVGMTPANLVGGRFWLDPVKAVEVAVQNKISQPAQVFATKEEIVKVAQFVAQESPEQEKVEMEALLAAVDAGVIFLESAITGKVAQIKQYSLDLSAYFGNAIPMNISAGFGTNLVTIPLEGHRFPTIQYMGGQQTAATIAIRTETPVGRLFVRDLHDVNNAYEQAAIYFREFSRKQGVTVTNPLLNSMGIEEVLIESISQDTIPGSPDGMSLVFRLVDNTVASPSSAPLMAIEEKDYSENAIEVFQLMVTKGWIIFDLQDMNATLDAWTDKEGHRDLGSRMKSEPSKPGFDSKQRRYVTYNDGTIVSYEGLGDPDPLASMRAQRRGSNGADSGPKANDGAPRLSVHETKDGKFIHSYDNKTFITTSSEKDPLGYEVQTQQPAKSDVEEEKTSRRMRAIIEPATVGGQIYGPEGKAERAITSLKIGSLKFSVPRDRADVRETKNLELVTVEEYNKEAKKSSKLKGSYRRGVLRFLLGDEGSGGFFSTPSFNAWAKGSGKELIGLMGRPQTGGGPPLDSDFGALYSRATSGAKFEKTNQAYPDLLLPPNPISGLCIDTHPDFFLVNESDTRLCNSKTLELIMGNDGKDAAVKRQGLANGLMAIENSHEGYLGVLGLDPDAKINSAEAGRDNMYIMEGQDGVNGGAFKTSGGGHGERNSIEGKQKGRSNTRSKELRKDAKPAVNNMLGDLPGRDVAAKNGISDRAGRKGYEREKTMISGPGGYDQSVYQEQVVNGFLTGTGDGEQLENLIKIKHDFKVDNYKDIFKKFTENYSSDHFSVRRAFPTFKVYLIDEDGELDMDPGEDAFTRLATKLASAPALDDFYGVNSIKEISIVHAKDMAASTCVIQVLDLDGVFYNRKFTTDGAFGPFKDLTGAIDKTGKAVTENKLDDKRNPFFSTAIKEGTKIIVKFGYVNDPNELETLFVGQIVQFEGTQLLTIVCQSYGTELVQHRFGSDPKKNAGFYNTYTADLIHDLLDREEVRHFGRWKLSDISLWGGLFGHEKLRPDGRVQKVRTWTPSVVDDNVYAPVDPLSTWAWFWGDLQYVLWDTTIWDVLKEMELRHPSWIAYPVPYGSGADARMTMFFGNPDMVYMSRPAVDRQEREGEFISEITDSPELRTALVLLGKAADPSIQTDSGQLAEGLRQAASLGTEAEAREAIKAANLRLNVQAIGDHTWVKFISAEPIVNWLPSSKEAFAHLQKFNNPNDPATSGAGGADNLGEDQAYAATMAWQGDRIRPFRNYELVSSMHDIIRNEIRTDMRDTYNSIELHYSDSDVNMGTFAQEEPETLTVNADDNIKEHHIRRTIEAWPNCTTTDLARRYAAQLLANSVMQTYKGSLTIIGRPKLKPYDILWLYDNYSDMAGPVEIQEVVHTISQETGMISEIVPNMIVTVSDDVKMLMVDAVGAFFTKNMGDFTNGFLMGFGLFGIAGGAASIIKGAASIGEFAGSVTGSIGKNAAKVLGENATKAVVDKTVALRQLAVKKLGERGVETATLGERAANFGKGAAFIGATTAGTIAVGEGIGGAVEGEVTWNTAKGFATGIGVGAAAMFAPITVAVSGIVAGSLLYKLLKYNSTREPILITPLIKEGKPYVIGLEGMETDGLICTDMNGLWNTSKKKWRYYVDGFEDGVRIVEEGWAGFLEKNY